MGISKITRNFQVTLPKDVRALKGLREGDSVVFAVDGDRVSLSKLDRDIIAETFGLWGGMKETGLQYTRRIRKQWRRHQSS